MAATTYRPDIDGLRGLAMFPILFLHAGLSLTPGGFIGVDIFFVISGYLIIDIVRNQLAAGKFSLLDFMSRRVRRIFPAAFVTVSLTLLAGWFLLGPYDYQQLAISTRYNVLFSANFFFLDARWLLGYGITTQAIATHVVFGCRRAVLFPVAAVHDRNFQISRKHQALADVCDCISLFYSECLERGTCSVISLFPAAFPSVGDSDWRVANLCAAKY